MPTRKLRRGASYIERATVSKAHGATAPTGEIQTDRPATFRFDSRMTINIGGFNWRGYVKDLRQVTSEDSGRTTRVVAIDMRDDLFNITVFARINMIDERTGEVWSTIEALPETVSQARTWFITDFDDPVRSTVLLDEIPDRFMQQEADTWLNQDVTLEKVYPSEVIQWLLALAGFKPRYSARAAAVLASTKGSTWRDSRYNIYNMDWNTGVKVAQALDEINSRLGLQMHYLHDKDRTMKFTKIGEQNHAFLPYNGTYAVQHEDGKAVQDDVDTGVWVVGERNLLQWTKIPLVPAWNQEWNKYYLDLNYLVEAIEKKNADLQEALDKGDINQEQFDAQKAHMSVTKVGDFLADDGFLEGKPFNDMTISEYIVKVPFQVYRLKGMENVLTEDEFNGTKPVRDPKITRPLVTNPAKDFELFGHTISVDTTKRIDLPFGPDVIELEDGYTVHEDTGHVVFSAPKFWFKEGTAINKKFKIEPDANHEFPDIIPDPDLALTVTLYGAVYRKFFGTSLRIGPHQVSGLRKAFLIEDSAKEIVFVDQADRDKDGNKVARADGKEAVDEYIPEGERSADDEAADIAASYLDRPRIVRSGSSQFIGHASHEPTGEVQRVTVTLDDGQGLVENVSYSNDEPSLLYDPQIELKRKIASQVRVSKLAQLDADASTKRFKQALKKVSGAGGPKKPTMGLVGDMAIEPLNKDNWVEVRNPEKEDFESGEPVAGSFDDEDAIQATVKSEVAAGDAKFVGVNVVKSSGQMSVVTNGIVHARVMGPVEQGQTVRIAEGGGHFEQGSGPVLALKTITEAEVQQIPVKVGGGGGDTIITEVDGVSILNIDLAEMNDATNSAKVDSFDLSAFLAEDGITTRPVIVLVWQQDDATENGVYAYDPTVETLTAEQIEAGEVQQPKWGLLAALKKSSYAGKLITALLGKRFRHMQFNVRKDDNAALSFNRGVLGVRLASKDNATASGIGPTWDGVTPDTGDLVMSYAGNSNDGIYITRETEWKRIARFLPTVEDLNNPPDEAVLVPGQQVNVMEGDVNFRRPFMILP